VPLLLSALDALEHAAAEIGQRRGDGSQYALLDAATTALVAQQLVTPLQAAFRLVAVAGQRSGRLPLAVGGRRDPLTVVM
jgi:hypothetical protein